ncbi:MAG: HlyD family efflux transporter periplasmic adaptor subunit [Elainellaceae cyanobacterium]
MKAQPQPKTDQNGRSHTSEPPKHRKRQFRRWIYIVLGLAAAGAVIVLFRPTPTAVDLATIEQGELEVTIAEEGKTRVRDRFVISAPVAGRMQRITLEEGDQVEAGQVVAQIDPLPLNSEVRSLQAQIAEMQAQRSGVETLRPKAAALSQAEARIRAAEAAAAEASAQVAEAEARLEQARRDRQRAESLYQNGAIARQNLEDAQLEETTRAQSLEVAQRAVDRAQAQVRDASEEVQRLQAEQQDPDYLLEVYDARMRSLEAELANRVDEAQRTEIRSPETGQVLRIQQKSQQFVEAGAPLLEVGNPNQLELVVDLLSSDAVQVNPGDRVRVEQWGGDRPITGRVQRVEPAAFTEVSALGVEEQRVNVIVELDEIPTNLGDQYRTETQIIVWESDDVLTVPIGALFRCQEGWCVFTVQDGQAQRTPVEIGQRNQIAAQVQQGLTAGDQVILHPSEGIQDGTKVRSRE